MTELPCSPLTCSPLTIPPCHTLTAEELAAAEALAAVFQPGQRVCLTTHVNPDGDGLGSEVGARAPAARPRHRR